MSRRLQRPRGQREYRRRHRRPRGSPTPTVGTVGIVLGVAALILAIPPITARSPVWPVLLGVVAVMFGIVAVSRGGGRVGWGAVGAGIVGCGLALLAMQSSVGNLNTVFTASLIASMLVFATPLTFAALGGIFSERSGVVNIGLEGMMLMGAFWGIWGADKTGSWVWGVGIAMISGGLLALVHAFFAIHLRADQIVGGVAVNFLALGITGYFFVQLYHGENVPTGVSQIPDVNLAKQSNNGFFAEAIGHLNLMIWVAILFVPLTYIVLFKTPIGLRIRACGEHPRAADTVGINVYLVRYCSVDPLRDPRGDGRCVPHGGLPEHLQRERHRRPRLHRARRRDLRQLAAVRRLRRDAPVRLLDRARVPAPGVLVERGHALPGAAVRPDADRCRRRDRPHDPACSRWTA